MPLSDRARNRQEREKQRDKEARREGRQERKENQTRQLEISRLRHLSVTRLWEQLSNRIRLLELKEEEENQQKQREEADLLASIELAREWFEQLTALVQQITQSGNSLEKLLKQIKRQLAGQDHSKITPVQLVNASTFWDQVGKLYQLMKNIESKKGEL